MRDLTTTTITVPLPFLPFRAFFSIPCATYPSVPSGLNLSRSSQSCIMLSVHDCPFLWFESGGVGWGLVEREAEGGAGCCPMCMYRSSTSSSSRLCS